MNEIENNNWYKDLVEDCKDIITEAVFTSRWALVEGYWNLGKRIREDANFQKAKEGNKNLMQGLAADLKQSERTLYYAIQFYDKYPKLDDVPEGKNITWNKLITKYLPSEEKKPKSIVDFPNAILASVEEIVGYLKKAVYVRLYFEGSYETYKIDNTVTNLKPQTTAKRIAHIEDNGELVIDDPDSIPHNKDIVAVDKKLAKSEPYALAKWFYELRKIPSEPTEVDMRNFKILLNFYPMNVIQGGIMWRLRNDPQGFWAKSITSAAIYRNFGNWVAESTVKAIPFSKWLEQNPSYDYKKFTDHYARADTFMRAFNEAKKNPLVYFEEEDYETYKKAIRIKSREAKEETK